MPPSEFACAEIYVTFLWDGCRLWLFEVFGAVYNLGGYTYNVQTSQGIKQSTISFLSYCYSFLLVESKPNKRALEI